MCIYRALALTGLAVISLGTGGIKPCVAAFGGDQFQESQVNGLVLIPSDYLCGVCLCL